MLIDILKKIPDHRDPQGREYKLWEVFYISILAVLSNGKTYTDIAKFMEVHFYELKMGLGLKWRRPPVMSAIQKIIVGTDPADVEEAFRQYSAELSQYSEGDGANTKRKHFCFDGKKLNGSFSHTKKKSAAQIFNIFGAHDQLILGHIHIDEKDSEIPALQKLLETLDLKDVVVTADALHCQKKLLRTPRLPAQYS